MNSSFHGSKTDDRTATGFGNWMPSQLLTVVFSLTATAVLGSLPCRAEDNTEALLKQKQGIEHRLVRMMVEGESVPLPDKPAITLALLAPNVVGGHAGVNRYFGGYQLAAGGRLYWSKPGFAMTLMAGPPELMALETAFLNALGATEFVQVSGPFLIYEKQDGATRLEFEVLQAE
ncbi:MAG: META domain-containing protein, partial [Terriglobia bacterium]